MKPIKKKTAKLFIALIAIAAVIGTIFTFVPMNFRSFKFTSLAGTINLSSDLGAGVYAEYDLKKGDRDYTTNEINRSIGIIKDVLEDNGYAGANVFAVDGKKIRIEIGYPSLESNLDDSIALLEAVGVGAFELRSDSSEENTYITGSEHIKSVEIANSGGSIFVVLNFNKAGEEAYKELLEATDNITVAMGGEVVTSFDSSSASAASSLPLSFQTLASAKDFAMRVRLGSMEVTLNPDTVMIDTMSSTMSVGNQSADPSASNFGFSLAKVMGIIALVLIVVAGLVYLIVKYGVIGAFQALATLFVCIIATGILCALEWIELSLSSIVGLAFGLIILLTTVEVFAYRFEEEVKSGKTIQASLEAGYKRSVAPILASCIALAVIFGVVAIVAGTELRVFGLITCLFSCLTMFSTLIMLPGFIKIFEAFNDGATKAYRIPVKEDKDND